MLSPGDMSESIMAEGGAKTLFEAYDADNNGILEYVSTIPNLESAPNLESRAVPPLRVPIVLVCAVQPQGTSEANCALPGATEFPRGSDAALRDSVGFRFR